MKKIIIATAIVLASGITAYSLSTKNNTDTNGKAKTEVASFSTPAGHGSKSDLATAD
ncbi:hypothetical protein [Mucilaginibacter dorajii]|uniref:Uncharacterized protein n=1 Tax=Mucilaginibacter dorajii TaxID=692994 RepID=A0ABP7PQF4_9SPHI|nr:hypothetical protein [Mucilaginibacter dorajii]MCS3737574.1 hypothetical protein [Mucilaginibacter dorajii]